MNDKAHRWEMRIFRGGMWLLAAICVAALATKARLGKPTSVRFHYLLIICMIAAVLAVPVPRLDAYVFSKLKRISVMGVEVKLLIDSGNAQEFLKYKEIPPSEQQAAGTARPCDQPFPPAELSGPERFHYERLSFRLYQIFDQVKDPTTLDRDAQQNYRDLVSRVGRSAIAMKHYTKALHFLLKLEYFEAQRLTTDELSLRGFAHLRAADEISNEQKKSACLKEALALLKRARQKDPREVRTAFNLGVGLLSLHHYKNGIRQMKKCIKLDSSIAPWAKWNIACGLKKLGRDAEALQVLDEIDSGCWWLHIKADDWFKE